MMKTVMFTDRRDAGCQLAQRLAPYRGHDVVVLGLPRGGVPVAYEVAEALDAPLDVLVVRKVGVPYQPELAMGAVGEDGVRIVNNSVLEASGVTPELFDALETHERAAVQELARTFRSGVARVPVQDRVAILVDDGIATGSTARAACEVARLHGARRVVLAVPVAPPSAAAHLSGSVDEFVCLETPDDFFAVGQYYQRFRQLTDDEVVELLLRSAHRRLAVPRLGSAGPAAPEHDDRAPVPPHARDHPQAVEIPFSHKP